MPISRSAPAHAELASALAIAFEFGIVGSRLVRNWADDLIETNDSATPWMIDLSFCNDADAQYLLRCVPGERSDLSVFGLVLGLAYSACRNGQIDAACLRDIGWKVYLDDRFSSLGEWALTLDYAIELKEEGHATVADVEGMSHLLLKLVMVSLV